MAESNLSLEQFKIVIEHLRFDHTLFWTRFGFMMISQTTLVGFFANALLSPRTLTLGTRTLFCVSTSVIGLVLTCLWWSLLSSTRWWVEHWLGIIRQNEEHLFGETILLRPPQNPLNTPKSLRSIGLQFLYVFALVWSFVLVGSVVLFIWMQYK